MKPKEKKPKEVKKKKLVGIHEKIFNVQQKVALVIKGGKHGSNGYSYAREIDIIAEVKPLLGEQRLVVIPRTKSLVTDGKQQTVKILFTLVSVDNPSESISSDWYGVGEDKAGSVVGTPIAYTMALKYYLAKMFMVETGEDAERGDAPSPNTNTSYIGKKATGKKTTDEAPMEDPVMALAKTKSLIASSRNIDGLIELDSKLKGSKLYNAEQKAELHKVINTRVDVLQNGQGK